MGHLLKSLVYVRDNQGYVWYNKTGPKVLIVILKRNHGAVGFGKALRNSTAALQSQQFGSAKRQSQ